MRRYVGEWGEGGSNTGHWEAGMTQRMREAAVMTSVMTSASLIFAMEMLEGQHWALVYGLGALQTAARIPRGTQRGAPHNTATARILRT